MTFDRAGWNYDYWFTHWVTSYKYENRFYNGKENSLPCRLSFSWLLKEEYRSSQISVLSVRRIRPQVHFHECDVGPRLSSNTSRHYYYSSTITTTNTTSPPPTITTTTIPLTPDNEKYHNYHNSSYYHYHHHQHHFHHHHNRVGIRTVKDRYRWSNNINLPWPIGNLIDSIPFPILYTAHRDHNNHP